MSPPTQTALEKARTKLEQAKARYQRLEARASVERRKLETRRKIIAGSLLLDALAKGETIENIDDLLNRITRDVDRKPFEGWGLNNER